MFLRFLIISTLLFCYTKNRSDTQKIEQNKCLQKLKEKQDCGINVIFVTLLFKDIRDFLKELDNVIVIHEKSCPGYDYLKLADILWTMERSRYFHRDNFVEIRYGKESFYQKHQSINHVFEDVWLSDKGSCISLLKQRMRIISNSSIKEVTFPDFLPDSYVLHEDLDRERFLERVTNTCGNLNKRTTKETNECFEQSGEEEDVWMLKAIDMNGGSGIHIFKNNSELCSFIKTSLQTTTFSDKLEHYGIEGEHHFIVQKYVDNPLLVNENKVSFRVLWAIVSIEPLRVIYFDKHGFVLSTTTKYTASEYDKKVIHLTNPYLQWESSPDKFFFSKPLSWVVENHVNLQSGKKMPKDWVEKTFSPQVETIIEFIANALMDKIGDLDLYGGHDGNFFSLNALDLIVDEYYKVWLTEVQVGPSFPYKFDHMKMTIRPILKELTDILLEINDKKKNGKEITNLDSMKISKRVI